MEDDFYKKKMAATFYVVNEKLSQPLKESCPYFSCFFVVISYVIILRDSLSKNNCCIRKFFSSVCIPPSMFINIHAKPKVTQKVIIRTKLRVEMFQMSILATKQMITTNIILHKFSFIWKNGFNNKPKVILVNNYSPQAQWIHHHPDIHFSFSE